MNERLASDRGMFAFILYISRRLDLNAQLQTSINTVTVDYSDLMQTSEKIR